MNNFMKQQRVPSVLNVPQTIQVLCCNPLQIPNHNRSEALRPPSKKITANHPWLTQEHVVCSGCRKKLYADLKKNEEGSWPTLDEIVSYSDDNEDNGLSAATAGSSKNPRQSISYQKLVVPEGMRSIYWRHFGFPANQDNKILIKDRIVCTLCHLTMSYKCNTSNLRMHLKNRHPKTLEILEATTPPPVPKEKNKCHKRKEFSGPIYSIDLSGTVDLTPKQPQEKFANVVLLQGLNDKETPENVDKIASNLFANTATAKTRQKRLNVQTDTLKFVSTELLSPDFIQSNGFINFIQQVNPNITLPTSKQIKNELIPLKYNELKDIVYNEIGSVNEISLGVEEWHGIDNQTFITITANFLKEDVLVSRVLCTLQLSEVDTCSITNAFANWGLQQERIIAIVTATQQAPVLEALQQWATSIPCFQYTLQQSISACFSLPNVEVLLWKCRSILAKYANSGSQISTIKLDYPKIWISTYDMIKSFCDNKSIIDSVTISDEVKLSCFDWEIINTILEILEPFTVTIQTLQEENPGLISIIKPLFWQLITNYLEIKNDETEFPYTVKTLLKSKLLFAYNNQTNNLLLQTSTTLDPRFKQVSFSTNEERALVNQNIKTMLLQFGPVAPTPEPPAKKLSGMEMLLGGHVKIDLQPKDRADFELSQFTSEAPIAFDQRPIPWWRAAELKYPTLIKLARTFMCIPACAIPASKDAEQRERFERQRANLSVDLVDKMIFLNGNLK